MNATAATLGITLMLVLLPAAGCKSPYVTFDPVNRQTVRTIGLVPIREVGIYMCLDDAYRQRNTVYYGGAGALGANLGNLLWCEMAKVPQPEVRQDRLRRIFASQNFDFAQEMHDNLKAELEGVDYRVVDMFITGDRAGRKVVGAADARLILRPEYVGCYSDPRFAAKSYRPWATGFAILARSDSNDVLYLQRFDYGPGPYPAADAMQADSAGRYGSFDELEKDPAGFVCEVRRGLKAIAHKVAQELK